MLLRTTLLSKISPLLNTQFLRLTNHHNQIVKIQTSFFSSSITLNVQNDDETPWYLKPEESPSVVSPLKTIQIPHLPKESPQTLENLVHYLAKELGIDNLIVFDMRNKSDNLENEIEGAYDMADFMVIGTGKSTKHLQKASSQLDFYIKHNLHKLPSTEGILKSGELAKYHRRLLKKGKTAPNYSKNSYGAEPNTWIMTDPKSDGIIIHMLTKERRNDLNLEYLWSDKSEKAKYARSTSNNDNDDIFSGIRYFHSSTKLLNSNSNSNFNVYDLSFTNYATQLNKLLRSHLVDSNETPIKSIQNHLDLMYSAGLPINTELLYSYFTTVLQSNEFNSSFASDSRAFETRNTFFGNILNKYSIQLTTDDILKFLPLLIISNSQFDNPAFLTIKEIIENPNLSKEKVVRYSTTINQFLRLSNKLTDSLNNTDRIHKNKIDLLLLSIYANRLDWIHFNQVIQSAITRNDISILKAALPLITACADLKTAAEFNDHVLPLLIESGLNEELEPFVKRLNQRIQNI